MRRKLIGLSAVALLAIGALLGKFGMPGLGSGDGGPAPVLTAQPASTSKPEASESEQSAATVPVVEQDAVVVRVEDRSFLVRGSDGEWSEATIAQVVERSRSTEPNASGIRVCIRRADSARAGDWGKLVEQLKAAGIQDTQIDWGNDQVP